MYSLHLTHPKWTHTRSSGQPCYSARGAVGGSVPCSRTPQSWYWRRILPPPTIPAGPEIRTHNLPLTSPTRYPLGHDCPIKTSISNQAAFCWSAWWMCTTNLNPLQNLHGKIFWASRSRGLLLKLLDFAWENLQCDGTFKMLFRKLKGVKPTLNESPTNPSNNIIGHSHLNK